MAFPVADEVGLLHEGHAADRAKEWPDTLMDSQMKIQLLLSVIFGILGSDQAWKAMTSICEEVMAKKEEEE